MPAKTQKYQFQITLEFSFCKYNVAGQSKHLQFALNDGSQTKLDVSIYINITKSPSPRNGQLTGVVKKGFFSWNVESMLSSPCTTQHERFVTRHAAAKQTLPLHGREGKGTNNKMHLHRPIFLRSGVWRRRLVAWRDEAGGWSPLTRGYMHALGCPRRRNTPWEGNESHSATSS